MNKRIMAAAVFVMMGTAMFAAKKKSKEEAKPKAEPAPKWVDSPTSVYPTAQYFQSVGTGADRASAELNAVRGIAAIFSQNVQSTTHASKRIDGFLCCLSCPPVYSEKCASAAVHAITLFDFLSATKGDSEVPIKYRKMPPLSSLQGLQLSPHPPHHLGIRHARTPCFAPPLSFVQGGLRGESPLQEKAPLSRR